MDYSYSYIGKTRENKSLYKLRNHSYNGDDFASWYSRKLIYTHPQRFHVNSFKLPSFLKPKHNGAAYTYEHPVVIEKVYLDKQLINEGIKWYYCGSVHQQFVNGFYGGLFSGIYNKLFTSWPMTNIIYPPKFIADGKTTEDYVLRQISQWTVNGIVRTGRVFTLSLAAAFFFDISEQFCKQLRNKEDGLNPLFAGAFTGSLIGLRRGIVRSASTSLMFAVFAVSFHQIDHQNWKHNPESFPNRNSPFFF